MKIENELKAAQKLLNQSLEENKNRIFGVEKEVIRYFYKLLFILF